MVNFLPKSVDLRSDIDTIYNQAQDRSCGPHAIANALDCIYDRAGKSRRHSRAFIWRWSQYWQAGWSGVSQGIGSTFESLQKELDWSGTCTNEEYSKMLDNYYSSQIQIPTEGSVKGIKLVRTNIVSLEDIKRRLASGIPIVILINIKESFYNLSGDWKKQPRFNLDTDTLGEHFVCIIGYDDASEKFLVENSWGDWGDGGFFGMPYDYFFNPNFLTGVMHIDQVPDILFKPVDDYKPEVPMYMTTAEGKDFCDRAKDQLKATLITALQQGGISEVVKVMQLWGVSDKHFEYLFNYPRGSVREYANSNPELDWSKQVWDQL